MANDKTTAVTEAELRATLAELAERIERGGLKAVTIKATTTEGELDYTFPLETEDERTVALLTIRKILGQVH